MDSFQTVQDMVRLLARGGGRPAVVALQQAESRQLSYAELVQQAGRLSRGLGRAGIRCGDPVALWAENRPEWLIAALAILEAGAVVVPLDVQLGQDAATHVLRDSDARHIFTQHSMTRRIQMLGLDLNITLLDGAAGDERDWRRLLQEGGEEPPRLGPQDPAVLFYTSGTTGQPKGVPLTHGNLAFQLRALLESELLRSGDRLLLPLPLHHVYPFVLGMLGGLACGAAIVLPQAVTGPQLIRALSEGDVSVLIGVPRLYSALYTGIESRIAGSSLLTRRYFYRAIALSDGLRQRWGLHAGKWLLRPLHRRLGPRLRLLASGGAALDPELARRLEALGWDVAIGYGLTETSPLLTMNLPGRGKIGTAGRAIPGLELRIAPVARPEAVEPGEKKAVAPQPEPNPEPVEGEIQARGPGVFSGYRHLPDQTREAFTQDGWLRTGDLGFLDEDGFLHITGRVSTVIVTEGGKNIQPDEVEEAYQAHPAIREIGILQRENRLVALVMPDVRALSGHGETEAERVVREALLERSRQLPSYQRVSDFAITPNPLPRTRLGKIQRHKLEALFEQARSGRAPTREEAGPIPLEEMSGEELALLEHPAASQVWDLLAGRYPHRRLAPDTSPQLDLGVDSMEWLDLALEIGRRTGMELDEQAIGRVETVRDLLREVSETTPGKAGSLGRPLDDPEAMLSEAQRHWLSPLGKGQIAAARMLYGLDWLLMRGLFRLSVEGAEHLPREGQFVLTPNHLSHLDPFALAVALGFGRMHRTYWGGWTGVAFAGPLSRAISRLAQVVPVDPERAIISSLAFGGSVLKRGHNLIWYPEGQRSTSGELLPFRPGIGLLLERFPVPVVPAFIQGTYEALPPHRFLPHPRRIRLLFSRPQDPRELARIGRGARPEDRIANALHDQVAALGRHAAAEAGLSRPHPVDRDLRPRP